MVLTGIQPPENMQKLASSTRGIAKCIPIPAGARAALSSHCIGPYDSTLTQLHNSATSMSGLHNDSPQRSAGSFNMVHRPVRKALLPTKLMGNHTSSSLNKLVDHDENDMISLCSSSPSYMEVGTPSLSSSSCLLPSFVNSNSWELDHQPIHSYRGSYTDHLQSSVLMEPSKLVVMTNSSASRSNITRIGSAESISTASSARLLGKGQSTRFSLGSEKSPRRTTAESPHVLPKDQTTVFDNDKMISAEDEYGSLACCLQGDFWAHPDGTLCDCEPLFKQEHGMQIDDMIFDIPLPGSLSSATTSKTARQEVVDQVAEYRSECTMNSFCCSLDLLGDGQDGGYGSTTSSLPLIRAAEFDFAPGATSSNIQADQILDEVGRGVMQELNSGKSALPNISTWNSDYNGNYDGGTPHLVRSCSLTILPPTSCSDKGVERSPSLLIRSSSLTNDIGLVQSRKRSFSASELSSESDHPDSPRNLNESRSQLQAQMQLHVALVKQRAMVLQKQGNLLQPGKKDDNQERINDGLLLAAGLKERSNPIQISDEAVRKKGGRNLYAVNDQLLLHNQLINRDQGNSNNNIVCGINDDLKYYIEPIKQVGIKSNLQQIKQVRRRHGIATDPQSVAARTRREKFSERIRMLQSLVPNGERLDTVSMLGQTLEYIRFLQHQVWELYHGSANSSPPLPINACEKWKDFMQARQHSGNPSSTTSP